MSMPVLSARTNALQTMKSTYCTHCFPPHHFMKSGTLLPPERHHFSPKQQKNTAARSDSGVDICLRSFFLFVVEVIHIHDFVALGDQVALGSFLLHGSSGLYGCGYAAQLVTQCAYFVQRLCQNRF